MLCYGSGNRSRIARVAPRLAPVRAGRASGGPSQGEERRPTKQKSPLRQCRAGQEGKAVCDATR